MEKSFPLLTQVRNALEASSNDGSFDGSLASARKCLEKRGFTWTPEFAAGVRKIIGSPKIPEYPDTVQVEALRAAQSGDYALLTRLAVLHAPDTEVTDRAAVEAWLASNRSRAWQ